MADLKRYGWLGPLLFFALACESQDSSFERRLEAFRERRSQAHETAMAAFPLGQDLDDLELDDLYSVEIGHLVSDGPGPWLADVDDIDIELTTDGRYLVTFSGPWEDGVDYYVLLAASEEQAQLFLHKPPAVRDEASYLLVFRLRSVSKPRLQVGSEVIDYDEAGALAAVAFQNISARILHGELLKVYEY